MPDQKLPESKTFAYDWVEPPKLRAKREEYERRYQQKVRDMGSDKEKIKDAGK